jgi:hypothetical protein
VGDKVEGPFDLIELAAQFRYATIDAATPVTLEGAEEWLAFRERPEFAAAQAISIEAIAAHLERRVRPEVSPKTFGNIGFWTPLALGLACVVGLVALLTPGPVPSPATVPVVSSPAGPAPWVQTVGDHFTVMCPVRLWQVTSTNPALVKSYRGFMRGAGFGVDMSSVTGTYSNVEDDHVVNSICDGFITGQQARVISDQVLDLPRRSGREILFTTLEGTKTFIGGIRVVADGGTIVGVWVTGLPKDYSLQDETRYLHSMEFR